MSFRITIIVSHHTGWDTKLVDLDDSVLRFGLLLHLRRDFLARICKVAKVAISRLLSFTERSNDCNQQVYTFRQITYRLLLLRLLLLPDDFTFRFNIS